MPNQKRPLRVFLCHSNENNPLVHQLYDQLCGEDMEPWLDERNLLIGQTRRRAIREEVLNSDVVIVCLSHNSVDQNGHLDKQIENVLNIANEKRKKITLIIPARLERCDIPARLTDFYEINLFEPNSFDLLMRSLHKYADSIDLTQTTNEHSQIQYSEKRRLKITPSGFSTVGAFILALLAFLGYSTLSSFWNSINQPNGANNPTATSPIGAPGGDPPTATVTLTPGITNTPASPTETQFAVQPGTNSSPAPSSEPSPALGSEASPAPGGEASPAPGDPASVNPAIVPNTQPLSAGGFEYSFGSGLTNVATGSYGGAPPARGQYLIVLAWVRNTGSTPQKIPDGFFVVKDAQGRVSAFNQAASVDYFNRFPGASDHVADAQLPPRGQLDSVVLLFDIAPDATKVVMFSRANPNQGFRVRE